MNKHIYFIRTTLLFSLFLAIIITSGCEESTTEPTPAAVDKSDLLINSLNIALVPGGSKTVVVKALDKDYQQETFDVSSDDESIASVTAADSTFTITGVNYGTTNLNITSSSGLSKTLPVKIYNLQVLETDELLITFAQTFQYRWNDGGSGGSYNGSFYHPITSDGFAALGSFGFRNYYNPDGLHGVMVVKAKAGSDALSHPIDYTLVYNDGGSGANHDGSFWTPVPDSGYVAMGIVAQAGYAKPNLNDVVCER